MKTITYTLLGFIATGPLLASAQGYNFGGYGMMGYERGGEGVMFLLAACTIVWTIVGILAGVWLWQHVNKK